MGDASRSRSTDLDKLLAYRYTPLPYPHWLRVLKLRPAPVAQDTIDCDLEDKADLRSDQGYEAVSWCWGKGANDKSIRIHVQGAAHAFQIYEHLYEALRALRHENQVRYLWIDAICINQKDVEERNQQVPKMTEIYGDAKNVCVWLGKADPRSDMALDFIEGKVLSVWSFDELFSKKHMDSWAALLELMKRPWFSRRWIVQEVALAQEGTVHCGRKSIDWRNFADAVSLFVDVETALRRLTELVRKEEKFDYARDVFQEVPSLGATRLVDTTSRLFKRSIGSKPQRLMTLEELVSQLAIFETSEPRDTIFALLALAKDSQPKVEGIPTHLEDRELTDKQRKALQLMARLLPNPYRQSYVVNYKQPVVDVYQQFIAFSISRADPSRALDIICRPFARSYTKEQDVAFDEEAKSRLTDPGTHVPLPSWIPQVGEVPFVWQPHRRRSPSDDEGDAKEELFSLSMKRQRGDSFVGQPGTWQESYGAAGTRTYEKSRLRFRKRQGHYSMFVEGFVLDTIEGVEAASQLGSIPWGWFSRVKEHKHDWDTFWRTLVADRGSKGRSPPVFYQRAAKAAFDSATPGVPFNTNYYIDQGKSEVVAEVLRRVQATIWDRRLIETERRLLGLGPSATKNDDVVCILYGCSVPVIMRKTEKSPGEMEDEERDDNEDLQRRLDKSKSLIQKIFDRRKRLSRPTPQASAAHATEGSTDGVEAMDGSADDPAVAESNTPVAGSTDELRVNANGSSTGTAHVLWQQLRNRPSASRVALLVIYAAFITQVLGEPLTAATLTFIATTHVVADLLSSSTLPSIPLQDNSFWDGGRVMALIIAFASVLLASVVWRPLAGRALGLLAFLGLLFPEVFPTALVQCLHSIQTISNTAASSEQSAPLEEEAQVVDAHAGQGDAQAVEPAAEQPQAPTNTPVPRRADEAADLKPPTCYYRIIGESYIHSMMNGGAIEWQNQTADPQYEGERVKAQIFEIR